MGFTGMSVLAVLGSCLLSLPTSAAMLGGFESQASEAWETIQAQRKQSFEFGANHKDGELDRISRALAHLVEESSPSLAKIIIPNPAGAGATVGSGFIVDPSGLMVTNAHVVDEPALGSNVDVEISGKRLKAAVVARSYRKDVALLQLLDKRAWPVLPLGSSTGLLPGQMVIAMGYPKGLPLSASMGIVSGTNRLMPEIFVRSIQSDAAVNPGNSGGPLISVSGDVVGVNTFIVSDSGGSEGLSFSIPVETIKNMLSRHRAGGRIESGSLGVTISSRTSSRGAVIAMVAPGSPAAGVNILAGDIITATDGVSLLTEGVIPGTELILRLADKFAGEAVVLSFERNGKPYRATAVLTEYQPPKSGETIPWPGKRKK